MNIYEIRRLTHKGNDFEAAFMINIVDINNFKNCYKIVC